MAPKKPNGFMQFTLEWKEKHGRHMKIAQATSAAGVLWAKMTLKQREPYLKRALANPVTQNKTKLTCVGTPLNIVQKEMKDKEKKEECMLKVIGRTIKLAVDEGTLQREKFYFIAVNYFVRLLNTETYVPAEIGIVEFSLLTGVSRKFHVLVSPNFDLYGNVYEAKHHADTTHNLPLPPNAMGESDMWKISSDILKFIFDENTGSFPLLYTHNNAMNYVSSALSFLSEEAECDDNDLQQLNIYSIQELFYALKSAVCDAVSIDKPRNRFVCDAMLERDVYEYANDIACNYHEDIDRSNYCALSQVNRWGFAFADYMANDLSITFIPGRHMPVVVDASVVMQTSSCMGKQSVIDACDRMSVLSLDSKYESCNASGSRVKKQSVNSTQCNLTPSSSNLSYNSCVSDDQGSIVSCLTQSTSREMSKSVAPTKRSKANYSGIEYLFTRSNSDYNPWRRADESKPPDSRYFSIDFDGDDDCSSVTSRPSIRGRGIAILDDFQL